MHLTVSLLQFILLVFLAASALCYAQEGQDSHTYNIDLREEEEFNSAHYMTGDWGGFRARLNEMGITPKVTYYMTVLGNPVGGEKKGVQYAGLLDAFLVFDLEKLFGITNSRFVISGSWASGRSLSDDDIGNFFTVSQVFSGRTVRLFQLFFEIEPVEDVIRIAVGRMAVGDEFSSSEIFYNYVSTAINGHPISFSINDEAYFSDPQASWAARVEIDPVDEFYIQAGVYNSNPEVGDDDAHGVDFSFRKGVILISEVGYRPDITSGSGTLAGRYTFGAFYDTRKFEKLSDEEEKEKGNYGLYWMLEQMVYRESADDDQGLTPWATFTISPDESINIFPFFVMGGLVYEGLFPTRNEDKTAFGFAYGTISDKLEDKDFELMLELTHLFQVTPWLQLQPDVQWIAHPGGRPDIPNALVAGMQLMVDL